MKKVICFLLFIVITFCVFTSCGNREREKEYAFDNEEEIKESYGNWEGKELEITAIDKGFGTEWLDNCARAFNRATKSNIEVRPDFSLNNSIERVLEAGTDVSDIYFTFSSELQWVNWAVKGDIIPLELNNNYRSEDIAKLGVYNKTRYTFPYAFPATGFVYNKEYLDEIPSYGEFNNGQFPTSWQGLLDLCHSVNNNWDKKCLGQKVVPMTWGGSVNDMLYIFKSLWGQLDYEGYNLYWNQEKLDISDQSNKVLLVNNNTIKALDLITMLLNPTKNNSGSFYPGNSLADSTGNSNIEAEQKFLNGLSVFTISGAWFENEMREQIEDEDISFHHFAPTPLFEKNGKSTIYVNCPSEYFVVTKKGKNKNIELAKAFLNFMNSESASQCFHEMTGVPSALKFETNIDNLSEFGKEIAKYTNTSRFVISASDKIPSLSGAILLQTQTMFQNIATKEFKKGESSKAYLESLYTQQFDDWNDTIKKLS